MISPIHIDLMKHSGPVGPTPQERVAMHLVRKARTAMLVLRLRQLFATALRAPASARLIGPRKTV
ncbi:hypothetical protein [Mesobacterium pallidum]|uniref:hypothetical protein n=1 Tax=Mesobacterium pallidum TaxID=2872037 RepID=UPI001EE33716|nr:hypothetical protein [Mesobacterium pallidum]